MSFSINLGAWNSVFAVPSALVDSHIKLAGSVQLKVLLWVLRHAGEDFTSENISKALGIHTADVNDAMQYWIETGLISSNTANVESNHEILSPANITSDPTRVEVSVQTQAPKAEVQEPPIEEKPKRPVHRMIKPDGVFVAERINQSEEIGFLMQETEQILGRPISPGLSSTLIMIHDDYGLPADVMIMLLQYVKSIHKDNTNYIESVAKNWSNDGIVTHEKAEEKLRQLDDISKAWRVIEKTIGINHRSPSSREEGWANRWMLEWNFQADMIREAYERCVNSTGKLSMSYMNSILERWHKSGISTTKEAAMEQSEKSSVRKQEKERKSTYDIDEFERMSMLDILNKE